MKKNCRWWIFDVQFSFPCPTVPDWFTKDSFSTSRVRWPGASAVGSSMRDILMFRSTSTWPKRNYLCMYTLIITKILKRNMIYIYTYKRIHMYIWVPYGLYQKLGTSAPNNYSFFSGKAMALRILKASEWKLLLLSMPPKSWSKAGIPVPLKTGYQDGSTMYFLNKWHANVVLWCVKLFRPTCNQKLMQLFTRPSSTEVSSLRAGIPSLLHVISYTIQALKQESFAKCWFQ